MRFNFRDSHNVQTTVFKDYNELAQDILETVKSLRACESVSVYTNKDIALKFLFGHNSSSYSCFDKGYCIITLNWNGTVSTEEVDDKNNLLQTESVLIYLHDTKFTTKTLLNLTKNNENVLCFAFSDEI